jgi:predicted Zn-dependent protease
VTTALVVTACVLVGGVVLGLLAARLARYVGDRSVLPNLEPWKPGSLPATVLIDDAFGQATLGRLEEAIRWAIQLWGDQVGPFLFVELGEVSRGATIPVMPAVDRFNTQEWTIAYTEIRHAGEEMVSAAIYINRTVIDDIDQPALRRAMAHELGHCLGLAHDDFPESIMYRRAASGGFAVTNADRELLCELYDPEDTGE